jgi:putative intracellular protease/amidase
VLADTPGHETVFVAAEAGPVIDHTGRGQVVATKSFAEVPAPEVIVVPGGRTGILDDRLVEWIGAVHPSTTWTTSVCTGAIYLAAAGLLEGLDATTHWAWAERH